MTTITVTIWHNVAADGQGRHTGMLEGYQPGDPMVRVFTYQARPDAGPEGIAEEALAICNGHPRDASGQDLVPPLLRAPAAVAVVPRKVAVLPEVMLHPPRHCVGRVAANVGSQGLAPPRRLAVLR